MHIFAAGYLGYKGPAKKKTENDEAMEKLLAQFADGKVTGGQP